MAGIAAYVSYWHAYEVVRAHGESGVTARLEPATIDGLVYSSSMVILYAARHRLTVPALAHWLLALGIVATLAANVAHGWSHGPVGATVAAWPAASLVGSYELLLWLIRTAAARAMLREPAADQVERGDAGLGVVDPGGLEVGGHNGREALARLRQVIGRAADQWRPATHYESFEIVRRRLFEETAPADRADINVVARTFVEFYARHRGEFPGGTGELAYEERIRAAYPIHPELFDRLYEDWSTLERFQRTRGVLRLMSAVIHALWVAGDAAPMIMPGTVPLDSERVRGELTQYLEDDFKPIIDADIDGDVSTPYVIDGERPTFGQRSVTRRIARAIFLGSAATLKSAHKGVEQPHIWLGVAVPGDTVGNFGSALHLLADRVTYLYGDAARYWYDTQASISRAARDYADRLRDRPEEVRAGQPGNPAGRRFLRPRRPCTLRAHS